jgi:hypothetical protein
MKRSEASPGLLEILNEPGMLYLFDEDIEEMNSVFSFIHQNGWDRTNLSDEQKKQIDQYLKTL